MRKFSPLKVSRNNTSIKYPQYKDTYTNKVYDYIKYVQSNNTYVFRLVGTSTNIILNYQLFNSGRFIKI